MILADFLPLFYQGRVCKYAPRQSKNFPLTAKKAGLRRLLSFEGRRGSLILGDKPGGIFTNPTLIELRQEIGQYDWLASPRADDVVLCSRKEIITKQAIECGL
ncbi:hypothetical protein AVEN_168391-1 [Araneus ventricosus]|uniref:Uncharacterized protein n=1 Tax=Araneus ventricosus TaxID=182803 RepID=A0A4Y2GR74_ARAVE|nr:hypothetical protein AVEN_168391-1 [Araneus ventricosus]